MSIVSKRNLYILFEAFTFVFVLVIFNVYFQNLLIPIASLCCYTLTLCI